MRLGEVLEILLLHRDHTGKPGCFDVQVGCVHRFHVHIIAIDVMLELTFLTLVVVDAVEEFRIEIGPFLESILLSEESWCHVLGDEGCLDEDGA